MENEVMDLEQLAAYLRRDVREVSKLANRGRLPGKKVGGQWRFASSDINYWMETQLPELTDAELENLEHPGPTASVADEPLVSSMLSEGTIAIPLHASTKPSALRELVEDRIEIWH